MLDSWFNSCISIAAAMALASCGGGGGSSGGAGGGAPVIPPPAPFTSMSEIGPNSTVAAAGQSVEGGYTVDSGTGKITGILELTDGLTAGAEFGTDAAGDITRISVDGSKSDVEWNGGEVTRVVDPQLLYYDTLSADWTTKGRFLAHNYQTFGIWMTGIGTGSGHYGAISAGAPTLPSALPTLGEPIYSGFLTGLYVDSEGSNYVAKAGFEATAKFADHTLSVRSYHTMLNDDGFDMLDFSGPSLTINADGTFNGAVTGSIVSGEAKGRFYGPVAQELGGTFKMTGEGTRTYVGAFGAAQLP